MAKSKQQVELQENEITHEDFLSISRRCRYNEGIASFYERMAEENEMPIAVRDGKIIYGNDKGFTYRAKSVFACSKMWSFDLYSKAKVKNLIRINRCKDRFCLNCQALSADQRFVQYSSILDSYSKDYDLYHVVLTVPNVDGNYLADTVTFMLDRFSYLVRYFDGRKKIRNLDMQKYGYVGAVRSLEITVSKRYGTYHPHLHCIFILKKNLDLPQVYWNRFSEDMTGRQPTRLFSELDLLIQRIWCLLILRVKVTKESIEDIESFVPYPDGFSCRADLSNGKYHEVFKYAIKGTYKEETIFKYETFLTLYKALFDRKCYETYGVLRNYDFNVFDESLGLNSPDEAFEVFLASLQQEELPKRIEEELLNILNETSEENKKFKYVSKSTFVNHFKALSAEEKAETLSKLSSLLR